MTKLKELLIETSERNRSNEKYTVYSVTNSDGFKKSTEYFSKKVFSKDLGNYKLVKKGYFAYNPSRINVGSIDYFDEEDFGLVSPLYVTFKVKRDIDNQYLKYYLKSNTGKFYIRNLTRGAVRDTLSFKSLCRLDIPIPCIGKQKTITNILDKLESIRIKRKKAIQLLDDFLHSIFLDIFGDPYFNSKKWPTKRLDDVCDFITKGTTPNSNEIYSDYRNGFVPFLKVYHIMSDGTIDFEYKRSFISKKIHGLIESLIKYYGYILIYFVV